MNAHTNELDEHIKGLMARITEAAKRQDLAAIQRLTRRATALQEAKDQKAQMEQHIARLVAEDPDLSAPTPSQTSTTGMRQLPVEVTDGMIRQNLLTLTPHLRSGKIKVGEQLMIEALPSGKRFATVLLEKGNKLQERGEIASFYREANVKGGDYVVLTEVAPGRWTLKKATAGQYGISRLFQDF